MRARSGVRAEFAFLFGRRLAYLVHLAAQLQIFWPVGDRAHEMTTRIRPSLRHQPFKLQLTRAHRLSRRFEKLLHLAVLAAYGSEAGQIKQGKGCRQ